MGPTDLQKRTKQFAIRIIKLTQNLDKLGTVGIIIGKQVLRSGTSVAANYRQYVGPSLQKILFLN